MAFFDVFNGDADGICALTQLRLAEPRDAQLVTGVKRDIELLDRVDAVAGDEVTVLDISLDRNRRGLQRLLKTGADIFYIDHHFAGDVPESDSLRALINTAPDVCTSLLVNGHLENRFAAWAVVGAFGDNLKQSAEALARHLPIDEVQLRQLEDLGTYMNYNGYGGCVEDLHFPPATLYRLVSRYDNPLDFIAGGGEHFSRLADGYRSDMLRASSVKLEIGPAGHTALLILPDATWSRRVSGVYSNDLTNRHPDRAHAVLTEKSNGHFLVSVRAPLNRKQGADALCRQFPTGGGRAAAAGINDLPQDRMDAFVQRFQQQYSI